MTSRCFAMADDEDSFAFVPFLDLCQHAADPAADFASGGGAFALRARRDLEAGEELTICYGADYSSRRLFKQCARALHTRRVHAACPCARRMCTPPARRMGTAAMAAWAGPSPPTSPPSHARPASAADGFVPAEGVAADAALLLELCPTPPPPPPSADAAAGGPEAEEGVQSGPQSSLQAADLDPLLAAFKEHKGSDLATSERLAAVYDALTADEAPCGHARPTRSLAPP